MYPTLWEYSLATSVWYPLILNPYFSGSYYLKDIVYPGSGDFIYVLEYLNADWTDGTQPLRKYSISENKFYSLSSSPYNTNRNSAGRGKGSEFVNANGILYLLNRCRYSGYLAKCSAGNWSTLTAAPGAKVSAYNATAVDDHPYGYSNFYYPGTGDFLYALRGDLNSNGVLAYKYSITGNSWTQLGDVPEVTRFGAMAYPGTGNYLYMAPTDGSTGFYRYDMTQTAPGVWETLNSSPGGNSGPYLFTTGNDNYIFATNGSSLYKFNTSTLTWATMTAVPNNINISCWQMSYLASTDSIYITSGVHFLKYSVSGNSWVVLDSLPVSATGRLMYPGSGDYMYTAAGYDGSKSGREMLRYSITNNKWSNVAFTPASGNEGSAAIAIGNYVYVFQGSRSSAFLRYSTADDSWDYMAFTPKDVSLGGALAYPRTGDDIYALRGNYSAEFWKYSITNNAWSSLAYTPKPVSYAAGITGPGGNFLYALKGGNTQDFWRYSITGNSWDDTSLLQFPTSASQTGYEGGMTSTSTEIYALTKSSGCNPYGFLKYSISGDAWSYISTIWGRCSSPQSSTYDSLIYPGSGDYIYIMNKNNNPSFWRHKISTGAEVQLDSSPETPPSGNTLVFPNPVTGDKIYSKGTDSTSWNIYSISSNKWAKITSSTLGSSSGSYGESNTASSAQVDKYIYFIYGYYPYAGYSGSFYLYRYDMSTDSFTSLGQNGGRSGGLGACIAYSSDDNALYTNSGYNQYYFYRYSLSGSTWTQKTAWPASPGAGAAMVCPNENVNYKGYVYALRGGNTTSLYRYSISGNTWDDTLTSAPGAISYGGAMVYPKTGNDLYVLRGNDTRDFYKYSMSGNSWSSLASTPETVYQGAAMLYVAEADAFYVLRGDSSRDIWKYSISTGTWSELAFHVPNNIPQNVYHSFMGFYNNYLHIWNYHLYKAPLLSLGSFISGIKDSGEKKEFDSVSWSDNSIWKLALKARSSSSADMSTAAFWSDCPYLTKNTDLTSYSSITDSHRYIQYKAEFSTADLNQIPRLEDITLNYKKYPAAQTLTSSAYNTTQATNMLKKISWTESLPSGTDIKFQLQTALDSAGSPGSWSGWLGPTGAGDYYTAPLGTETINPEHTNATGDQWFQYKVFLSSGGSTTPVLSDLNLEYIPGEITVTAPNGGEVWLAGSSHNITWTSAGVIAGSDTVKLEYSTNGGTGWTQIIASTPNNGTYSWSVPDNVTAQGRVRITSNTYSLVTDSSDADFRITAVGVVSPNGAEEWEVSKTHNISWVAGGAVNNDITLQYSTNGTTWVTIDSGQLATSSYPWTVPNAVTTTAKIKVFSNGTPTIYDTSDADFTIAVLPKITITSPNGAESWEVGSSNNITWDKAGRLYDTVDLYYSIDGGTSWTEIALAQTNSGTYAWTVPDTVGSSIKVKVIEAGVPASRDTATKVEDLSDADFSIIEPTITITSPNGSEIWAYGDTRNITWTATGTVSGNLLLEYSKDNFTTATQIATGEANDGTYAWTLPNDPSETLKVRITDNNRTQIKDTSDNYFTLLSRPRITITQPNGGELLTIGDSYSIQWNSDGQITAHYLKIEYSKDNFAANVNVISNYTLNDGEFTWLSVADDTSSTVKIRISDLETGFSDITDTSDNYFEVKLPSVTLTSPNGAESWYATGVYPITWTKGGAVGGLTLEYSLNNGTSWTTIATNVNASLGTYDWTVANSLSSQALIRIKDPLRATTTDTSEAVFNIIAPSLTLTSPNGAESWIVGTSHNITWTSVGTNGSVHDNLTLQYSVNGASGPWIDIATGQSNDGTYSWTIADNVSSQVRLKLFDASRTATVDTSDANFAIASPTLTLTSPNGAEQWVVGISHNITWTSVGTISTNHIKLEYSSDGGATWTNINTDEPNDGIYIWTVPNAISGTCKVRITDTGRLDTPTDTSDGVFSILVPQITVTRPNGGELFTVGDIEAITWSVVGTLSGNLKLEYSKDNFISDINLIDGAVTNSLTSYNWTIPSNVSTTVRVRITDVGRTASTDKSNTDFTILPIPEITITAPNGGENWIIGTQHNVTWTDNGGAISNNLKLEYTVDGTNWITIATAEANDGSYAWVVPSDASSTARIRITDASRLTTVDTSNNYFTIAVPTITISSPNGGEFWAVGDSAPVTWSSVGSVSDELVFYYSVNSGTTWNTIATNEANDGAYTWTVPNDPSALVRFKIVDGARPASSDISDANLSIIPVPTITLTAPNGGETYVLGEAMNITWTSKGLSIGLLKIEYSADNFATSRTIAQDVSNTGSYVWTVPEDALSGANIKVRITDQSRAVITDTSDAIFRIRGGFTITSPKGGESWGAKSPQTITWTTKGTIANVKLEYSVDSGSTWSTITSSVANAGSYSWTVPDVQKATCRVRVSDVSDATVNAVSAANFSIVYYTITWNILDYDTYSDLRNLNVNCGSGWVVSDASLTSPITHSYPYGNYTTFWSKSEYIERSTSWTANADKSVTLYLESSISAQIEWHVLSSTTYAAETDTLKTNSWLERRGKMVGLTAVEKDDLKTATLQVYDGNTLVKEMSSSTPDSQGVFSFSWANTGLESGKTYFVKMQIKYREATYTSGGSINITTEKKQYEQKEQLLTLQTSLEAKTADIKTTVTSQATETQAKVAAVKTETAQILTATGTDSLSTKITDVKNQVVEQVQPHVKSAILNRESIVKQGAKISIRYRTDTGLSPVLSVYNPKDKTVLSSKTMLEVGTTGIYQYNVTFSASWGKGDFTVICSEPVKGTVDALVITVKETDIEEVSSSVSAVLGSTSGLTGLKGVTETLSSQFVDMDKMLAQISKDTASKVTEAKGAVDDLATAVKQLEDMSKQIKNIGGTKGMNLEKLYNVSKDKNEDITYIKNKSEELKAAMELNKKMIENVAKKPVVQTWFEFK